MASVEAFKDHCRKDVPEADNKLYFRYARVEEVITHLDGHASNSGEPARAALSHSAR